MKYTRGQLAQLEEHCLGMAGVEGSTPSLSIFFLDLPFSPVHFLTIRTLESIF